MASSRQLTRRIKSVSNISKITRAMEMVSAAKMRRAQEQALSTRPYARKLDEILGQIAHYSQIQSHPLMEAGDPSKPKAMLIISTDRGLTGSLNANLFRSILNSQVDPTWQIYTIGRLAKEFTIKSGLNLKAEFGDIGDRISYDTVVPVARLIIDDFLSGQVSSVKLAYMDFISTLTQKPRHPDLLPVSRTVIATSDESNLAGKTYTFEPSARSILDQALPYYIEMTIYQSLLEARASEHSARMVAMKNASDNALELKDALNLQYNRSRQASITSELLDIVTATASLN